MELNIWCQIPNRRGACGCMDTDVMISHNFQEIIHKIFNPCWCCLAGSHSVGSSLNGKCLNLSSYTFVDPILI